jgi:hypothetical protein
MFWYHTKYLTYMQRSLVCLGWYTTLFTVLNIDKTLTPCNITPISLGGPVYKLVYNAHYIVCLHCSKYDSFTITMVFDASMVVTNLMFLVFICPYWCQTRLPDVTCIYLPILMSNTITFCYYIRFVTTIEASKTIVIVNESYFEQCKHTM